MIPNGGECQEINSSIRKVPEKQEKDTVTLSWRTAESVTLSAVPELSKGKEMV